MVEFIRIENTFEKAKYYRKSPIENIDMLYINGIQLLPNNPLPYIQRTNNPEGVEIEDFTVDVIDLCGNIIGDVTGYFHIDNVFTDLNGKPQIDWSLTDVGFDAGDQLIMLKINQGSEFGDIFYTSPFKLTRDGEEFTTRWDYTNIPDQVFLSTQLNVWYRQSNSTMEIRSYNDVVDGKVITADVKLIKFENWKTSIIDRNIFEKFKEIFTNRIIYADLKRVTANTPIETPIIEDIENYFEVDFTVSVYENDTYDPLYVPITPPTPEPPTQEIILDRVQSLNNLNVNFYFSLVNIVPDYVQLQYASSISGTWIGTSSVNPVSPRFLPVPNHRQNGYYYRIIYPPLNLISNVVQLPEPSIVINNITATPSYFNQSGNTYSIVYEIIGYDVNTPLQFEASVDGNFWIKLNYNEGNDNPKNATTPFSQNEFRFFRIKDYTNGITSNIYTIIL